MTAATHRLGGLAAGMAVTMIFPDDPPIWSMAAIMAGSIFGSLLPDIDHARSSISCRHRAARFFVGAGQAVIRGIAQIFPKKQQRYVRQLVGHRGISHSLFMAAASSGLTAMLGLVYHSRLILAFAAGLGAGILSHIILDMFANGAPLFMPFTTRRVTLAHIKTGGAAEWFIRTAALFMLIVYAPEYAGQIGSIVSTLIK